MENEKKLCRGHYVSLMNFLGSYRMPVSPMDEEYKKYSSEWRYMIKRNIDFLRSELFSGQKGKAYLDIIDKFYEYKEKKDGIEQKYTEVKKDETTGAETSSVTNQEELSKELLALETEYKPFKDQYHTDMSAELNISKPLYAVLPKNVPQLDDQNDMDFLVDLGVVKEF